MLSNSHGNCEDKKKLYYFDTYTRENCRMNCLGGRAKELCGCRAAYMPHKNGKRIIYCRSKFMYQCVSAASYLINNQRTFLKKYKNVLFIQRFVFIFAGFLFLQIKVRSFYN